MSGPVGSGDLPFWERPELVERFEAREPDRRLVALLEDTSDPSALRVLDLGCAAGRNTVILAERGADVHALDASAAMVARTRERLGPILGVEEARRRVAHGDMGDLGRWPGGFFDLVLGLGIYHQASSPGAWARAIGETARVLAPGGRLLYASFSPRTAPEGRPGTPVPGRPRMFAGFRSGVLYLIGAGDLDRELGLHGLIPETPTETVRIDTERGWRVTVNGLYRKIAMRAPSGPSDPDVRAEPGQIVSDPPSKWRPRSTSG